MNRTVVATAILSLCAILSACVTGRTPGGRLHMTAEDSDSTGMMSVGDMLIIELAGNPTTGYQWQLDAVDTNVLGQQGEPMYAVDGNAMGAGGTYVFRFKAVAVGETTLRLTYRRPWEKSPQDEVFEAVIAVKE